MSQDSIFCDFLKKKKKKNKKKQHLIPKIDFVLRFRSKMKLLNICHGGTHKLRDAPNTDKKVTNFSIAGLALAFKDTSSNTAQNS